MPLIYDAAPCYGVEVYVDFSPFVAEAEKQLARSVEGVLPDPTGMLGVDQGLWLLASVDVFPGTRIDGSAFLNVPKDTLAATLAEVLGWLVAKRPMVTRLTSKARAIATTAATIQDRCDTERAGGVKGKPLASASLRRDS